MNNNGLMNSLENPTGGQMVAPHLEGVAILLKNGQENQIEISNIKKSHEGLSLSIQISIDDLNFIFMNINAPNLAKEKC